jgi:hypothetical protein
MSGIFRCALQVGWEHLDSNAHLANTAYLDLAVNVRVRSFQASGFALDGLSDDASHFRLRNEFFRTRHHRRRLYLNPRRLTAPPEAIVRAYASLARTEGFEVPKSSLRK